MEYYNILEVLNFNTLERVYIYTQYIYIYKIILSTCEFDVLKKHNWNDT